ncbi:MULTISPECIES: beta-galactosidase [unclassified Duganella]|uniref:beta-galactosidase n=1 Tax=unclassified Duganella TaxID=2636909 RepID=UPI0006F45097|nr:MULTISPECIES: beta-galactosidase [unclassified Duganella]KQV61472.1 beta-galactosidase [Duganella sp. Root336D2]KRB92438.1 beta-galactosidase [Duganella sp. Root198D2]
MLRHRILSAALAYSLASAACAQAPSPAVAPLPTILYGAAYYHEYMPYERLEKDVQMMKAAGFNVVRLGESTWSLWEPEDGRFEYAWMDRVIDAMGKAGIKVIMGTPTYSIPAWMAKQNPEILARKFNGAQNMYGMRQNMNTDSAAYRFYAERLIRKIVSRYKDNPNVIGWQVDNETSTYGAANDDVFVRFQHHLEKKFGTPENLSKAWFLNYWGQNLHSWLDLPRPDAAQSTGYKLEWSRWGQMRVTGFLHWQANLVRENASPRQFVTHDFAGAMHSDVNEEAVSAALDMPAVNIYHWGQREYYNGAEQTLQADFTRSLKRNNFLVTETNAQSTDWSSSFQYPPYDGQFRQDVYTHLSNGSNMVEYWHWSSIHANQETYWKGVLSHDMEPNRAYAEMSRTGRELQKIGPRLVNLKLRNDVAILWSRDSLNALNDMPFAKDAQWGAGGSKADYGSLVRQMHRALYDMKVGADFVFPEVQDFSQYKLLLVPALYVADDALLKRIAGYIRQGGRVVMTFKSGFANENAAVRWSMAPGPLREALGFHYQEFSNLAQPLALKGDPFQAGADNKVQYWAEFLQLDTARALAYYDHHFFGRWPAITQNQYGAGTVIYEGTYLTDKLQKAVLKSALEDAGLSSPDQQLPPQVHTRSGTNGYGKTVRYFFNYSAAAASFSYQHQAGTDLLSSRPVKAGDTLNLGPWDLAIVEEGTGR